MVNEIKKIDGVGIPGSIPSFTVAPATAISQGTLLKMTDPRTASASTATDDPIAGVAAMDKEGSAGGDASTRISVWTHGRFKGTASGAITIGNPISSAGEDNKLKGATDAGSGSIIIGYSLETVANGETFHFRLNL